MKKIIISDCRVIKLNSFMPLCINEYGRLAIEKYNYPPFIDASCRREPDLENRNPSISALCRQGSFAPHLKKGDVIVYITVKGKYPPYKVKHHRLIAILQVEEVYDTHEEGMNAYLKYNNSIPSNCMVHNNPPYNYDQTAGNIKKSSEIKKFLLRPQHKQDKIGSRRLEKWNNEYLAKSQQWRSFIRTKKIYTNLENPIPIFLKDFEFIFGKLPNTRTPPKITKKQLFEMGKLLGIEFTINP